MLNAHKRRYEASLKKCFIAIHNLPSNKSPFMSSMRNEYFRVINFTLSIINNSDVIFCDSSLWYALNMINNVLLSFQLVIDIKWKCLWRGCDESWHNFRIKTFVQVMKWQQKNSKPINFFLVFLLAYICALNVSWWNVNN